MTVRLYTLGRLSLERDGNEVSGDAAQSRRLALMALLAVAGTAGLMREKILGFLWPEHASPRAILNESLFVLRCTLGKSAILSVGDSLRLNPEEVWTDVQAFQNGISAGALQEAVDLYRGPFLDGFYVRGTEEFEQWVGREQDRLRREFARALERLAEQAATAADLMGAVDWWRRLAEHEQFSTRVALRYVEALVRAGEPVLAVRYATRFTEQVRKVLGIEPEASVLEHAKALIVALPEFLPPSAARAATQPGDAPAAGREHPAAGAVPPGLQPTPGLEGLAPDLEVVGLIEQGSIARIYLAREPILRRLVAVKVLSPALAGDDTVRARFDREARAAASIQHPNVAPVYRTGRLASGIPYLVMPYFRGGSLENRLKAAGPLQPEEARRYIGQIAAGLAAAHRLGIVHRDVRPANILYDHEAHRVVLIDFGIAAAVDEVRLTLPGQQLGTPAYASPEQLRGGEVTDRADVYSLGVVAFEMLTGRLPFEAGTAVQMMKARAEQEPRPVTQLRPEVGAELGELVGRCLSSRPEERPPAAAVAEAVNR